MKIFAIYVGGAHPQANIELHDMRFVAAERIEDTYPTLRHDWWGKKGSLHLDCWVELTHADGYDISLQSQPSAAPEKLFYVNLGGYDGTFTEQHRNLFVVASDKAAAKQRALALGTNLDDLHRDNQYDVDNILSISEGLSPWYIHLTKVGPRPALAIHRPAKFFCI